jgi:hypothetical protein
MRQIAYPATLGSCVLGAGVAPPVRAAEWSLTPVYSSSVDYDTNRSLQADKKRSAATILLVDLKLKYALEDFNFTVEPHYMWRRFDKSSFGNGDDRGVSTAMNWTGERSVVGLTASYLDQSTLVTEILETGLVNGDTHRRATEAGATWNWFQTERRSLVAQFSYPDVSYYGLSRSLLPGYRYPSASVGEQLAFNERGSITVSVFGSRLLSSTEGNSSHEVGLQAETSYLLSEKTKVDVSLGKSRRVLTGDSSTGTVASVSVDHSLSQGKVTLAYKRSLVPYGFGFLFEQQQFSAAVSRSLTPYLDCNLALQRTQNNDTAVLLHLDRRNYNSASVGLTWHPEETWSVGTQLEGAHTQTPDIESRSVSRWRGMVSITWSPFPKSRSW